MSTRVCGQCEAITSKKKRCKRVTCRTKYCFSHQPQLNIQVKKSNIKDGGLGVFWTGPNVKAKTKLVEYGGVLKYGDPHEQGNESRYILELTHKNNPRYLDGDISNTGLGSFSNSCLAGNKRNGECKGNNCDFHPTADHNNAWLKSTKPIKHNQELFANYGRQYWR